MAGDNEARARRLCEALAGLAPAQAALVLEHALDEAEARGRREAFGIGPPPPAARGARAGLTPRQERVLRVFTALTRARGTPPTVREVGRVLDLPNTNAVADQFRALEQKGYLRRVAKGRARCLVPVDPPEPR